VDVEEEVRDVFTLRDVLDYDISLLERILSIDKVEIGLEVHHVGVQCSGNGLLDSRSPLALVIWTVVVRLNIA
jgi:hypothetical protein